MISSDLVERTIHTDIKEQRFSGKIVIKLTSITLTSIERFHRTLTAWRYSVHLEQVTKKIDCLEICLSVLLNWISFL